MRTRSFVTGGTGLVGQQLCERLLRRGQDVSLLVRETRRGVLDDRIATLALLAAAHHAELAVVVGDVTEPWLGLDAAALSSLAPGRLDHVFHLAALYDLSAAESSVRAVNVDGTKNLLEWLVARGFGGVLHHVSSIAVAGDFAGRFTEEMFDVGQSQPTPYHRSKLDAEALVRAEVRVRSRIYRPGAVVGHSKTGEMDRLDGPYYLFQGVHAARRALPPWVTIPSFDGGRVPMVPVDFVADAIDAIAHQPGHDGKTFHVVDPATPSFRTTWNLIAAAAEAPKMGSLRLGALGNIVPGGAAVFGQLGSVRFIRAQLYASMGVPPIVHDAQNASVQLDATNLVAALASTSIACPPQSAYVEALWDYYVRHLDRARDPIARARRSLAGRVMLVTGPSSGIGEELARQAVAIGMKVVLVARREEELQRVVASLGDAASYVVADLSDLGDCDAAVATALEWHGAIDVLVNNAGRSIRRPLEESLARFHDLERVMQLNYFAPARMIRGVLPSMLANKRGTIVNVLSAGARMPSPRFGAYTASKATLGQLGDTLAAEHLHDGIRVVNAYLPWVRTPMMDATGKYADTKAMSPAEAARLMLEGIVEGKQHVVSADVRRRFALAILRPEAAVRVLNVLYRIYADDPAAYPELDLDRAILKRFVKGRLM